MASSGWREFSFEDKVLCPRDKFSLWTRAAVQPRTAVAVASSGTPRARAAGLGPHPVHLPYGTGH